jgi:hypothetical protein
MRGVSWELGLRHRGSCGGVQPLNALFFSTRVVRRAPFTQANPNLLYKSARSFFHIRLIPTLSSPIGFHLFRTVFLPPSQVITSWLLMQHPRSLLGLSGLISNKLPHKLYSNHTYTVPSSMRLNPRSGNPLFNASKSRRCHLSQTIQTDTGLFSATLRIMSKRCLQPVC